MPSIVKIINDRPVVRMMILEADNPHPKTVEHRGSYSKILDQHFKKAGKNHDPPLDMETDRRFVVTEKGGEIPRFDEFNDFHAILITGSMYDAFGEDQWILDLLALLRELWARRPDIRFSGVCFGHQLLCRLLGSRIQPAPSQDWELAHTRIDLTEVGQKLFRTDKDHIGLHQMHRDQVAAAPTVESANGLLSNVKIHVFASTEHTPIQGVYIPDRLFTTQAHLSFDEEMVKREIEMREDDGAIDDQDDADEAREKASFDHDGEVVAMSVLRFFHGEDQDIS